MELATILTNSETGFSDPEYKDALPDALLHAGMSEESWQSLIQKANNSVKFEWNIGTICCFLTNAHNKRVARNMALLCDDIESLLPDGVKVDYQMATEKQFVRSSGADGAGTGATLETYHKLVFTRKA
jgi:hypothetical protein